MLRIASIALLAALAAVTAVAPVAAEDGTVAVTKITLDRKASLSSEVAADVRVTGTITCETLGPADLTTTTARQGEAVGQDNWDLYEFPCSTNAQPFTVVVESLTCDPDFAPEQCFTRGMLEVEVVDVHGNVLASGQVFANDRSGAQGNGQRPGGQGRGGGGAAQPVIALAEGPGLPVSVAAPRVRSVGYSPLLTIRL